MQNHVRNYLVAFNYYGFEFISCEICGAKAVDIHHVDGRSYFGSKNKDAQDDVSNLVALCRFCHNSAHGPTSRAFKEKLKEMILKRILNKKTTTNMEQTQKQEIIDAAIAKGFITIDEESIDYNYEMAL